AAPQALAATMFSRPLTYHCAAISRSGSLATASLRAASGKGKLRGCRIERAPDVADEDERTQGAQDRARAQGSSADEWCPGTRQPADHHQGQSDVRNPEMCECKARTAQRRPAEARNHVVCDTEDHHADEAEQVGVHVCGTIDHRSRREHHPDTEQHTRTEPEETPANEVPDVRVHACLASVV